jgi:hypothetical protein
VERRRQEHREPAPEAAQWHAADYYGCLSVLHPWDSPCLV